MKHTLLRICGLMLVASMLRGQNLVSNPSFEGYTTCPISQSHMFDAVAWRIAGQTPDLYNTCSYHPANQVPTNSVGTQMPASGNGYGGGLFWGCFGSYNPNIREYSYNPLLSPLVPGTTYYVSFRVSLADYATHGCDHLGLKFCNSFVASNSPGNSAEFYNTTIITDKTNWVTVSGSFVAASAFNAFMLGNWYQEVNTNTINVGTTNNIGTMAYYYFDDVYVGPTPFVLPIAWRQIDVAVQDDMASLSWELEAEALQEFVVEHSEDGINFVESQHRAANPANQGSYQVEEALPGYSPSVLYRVRAITQDGGTHLSPVVEARRYAAGVAQLYAYPSPVQRAQPLMVAYRTEAGEAASAELVALDGRVVRTVELPADVAGTHTTPISVSDLAPGSYVLRVGPLSRSVVVTD